MISDLYIEQLRRQFPILDQQVNEHALIYLDNAATTQKPQLVIDAICHYYQTSNANVHRSSHTLSNQATQLFEQSREKVQHFINAKRSQEIIWTKGTTEGFNLLANVFAEQLNVGDEIIISAIEHHANIVPWQILAKQTGAIIKVIPLTDEHALDIHAYQQLLSNKTKIVTVAHVSNALGIVNPIKEIIDLAHQFDAKVMIDGAQAIAHIGVDVQQLDCDFYLFSGHKLYGPTGVGVLYGKYDLLDQLPVWQGGGEMIKTVTFEESSYNQLPFKYEAGTPNIAGAIGLGAAIDFMNELDAIASQQHELRLIEYTENALSQISEIEVFAKGAYKSGSISFIVKNEHSADIAMLLNAQGIAVRSGTHCAMPLMSALNCNGTIRVSFSIYNTLDEAKMFIEALKKVIALLVD
ncbi:cysteine desulfurase [Psychromonas sp. RZ22]|uniref:aminotransferase class V-fold PLP-dependent enzyme n=1 Tax=Psychromonas algarum TaxID=2555643 RepID=UPI001067B27E|nr:cysteine desulfurase [Psychromonas sp. RZ22]TEW53471.1 cysteine desulfurase [Psychromonas sp. RZ22]